MQVLTLSAVMACICGLARSLLSPPTQSDLYHMHTSLALLHLPLLALMMPTSVFCYQTLFAPLGLFVGAYPTFRVFASERINFLLSVLAVLGHYVVINAWGDVGAGYACVEDMPVNDIASKLLGRGRGTRPPRPNNNNNNNSNNNNNNNNNNSASKEGGKSNASADSGRGRKSNSNNGSRANGCVHEDGGKLATFEQVPASSSSSSSSSYNNMNSNSDDNNVHTHTDTDTDTCYTCEISPGVVLGATYKVVSCECYKDLTLKSGDQSGWCEYVNIQ